jgi:hypothetical protein
MALNYERLMGLKRDGDRFSYGDRETMLYAIGMGGDPAWPVHLRRRLPRYPGESIATDLWVDGAIVSFRCRIPAREDVVVINNGRCLLAP